MPTREELQSTFNVLLPDNTSGDISPSDLRSCFNNVIDSVRFPLDSAIIEIDQSDIAQLILDSALISGSLYKINGCHKDTSYGKLYNDGTDSGTTIYLHAISNVAFESIGTGEFYAPKAEISRWTNLISIDTDKNAPTGSFDIDETVITDSNATIMLLGGYTTMVASYVSGDILGTTRITGNVSGASIHVETIGFMSTYQIGDTVSFGGYVWENLTGERGTANGVSLDVVNWQKLAYSTQHYNILYDVIEYDITANKIISRRNAKYNNRVSYSVTTFIDSPLCPIAVFEWNNENVNGNNISNAHINLVNYQHSLTFSNNTCNYSQFNSDLLYDANVTSNIFQMASLTLASLLKSNITSCVFESGATIADVNLYTTNITQFTLSNSNFLQSSIVSSAISNTKMYGTSELSGINATALTIELCDMNYASIALCTFNQMNISKCLFKNQSGVANLNFSNSAFINLEFNYGVIIGFVSTGSEFMNLKIYYSTINYTDNDWSGVDFRNTEILITDLAEVDLTQGTQILTSDYKTVYTRADGQVRQRFYSNADELVILDILE